MQVWPQGLSQVFDYFRVFNNFDLQDYFVSFQFLLLSFFNSNYLGVIASDRGFISSFDVNFLTFLPLPSGLFGSDLLKESLYDNLITRVVPYPGASQLVNSGYIMLSFGIIYYAIMFSLAYKVKQIYSNTLPYFIVVFISVVSFLISYQYPLRLSSRLSWMSIALSSILILFRNRFLSSRRPEY